ncbi:MAG: flavin reductase family protein [Chloroflexi bacterium]|nr:flavin reductase family protein [Chloroflexota bacterium]
MDATAKKLALRKLTYGLYVLTVRKNDNVAAGTVTWLSQASFEPPLIMVGVKASSGIHSLIERVGAFAINILAEGQKNIAAAFFRPSQIENDRINGYAFEPGPKTNAPLLLDAPAWLEARVVETVKRGDHTIYVAEIVEAGVRNPEAKPLELSDTGWSYGG